MDRYIKKKKIGEGSFGTALLVQSKADGKNYVIKEINISKMKRKEKEEAKKEVSVLRKMKHPNIVSYTESFEELGNLYIVMDYCDGGDLYQRINARRGVLFQEDIIMDWFVQICLALKHVHDRKILHRDIKSQNIFLTSKGIIKMGDFGIARVLNNTMELARTCIGTPYYLSPEICENKPYNNKSDIWALGCVLYELCTLKHAFEAGNMKNLVLKIIRGSCPPISPTYTYDIKNLVNQLFKRNPRDRPSVNTILKKNFIMKRIRKYLTDAQLQDEFNDTVLPIAMEGQPPRISAAVKIPADRVSEGVRISAPAAKYGAPMRKKAPAGRRPPSGDKDRRQYQSDLEQKNRDLVAKEKERRQKEMHFKAQKQKLVEKQKMLQIRKAREAGWKTTLSSNGSSAGGGGGGGGGGPYVPSARPLPQPKIQPQPAAARKGNYDHYHQYLDNINARQKVDGGVGNVALYRQDYSEDIRKRIQERPVSASAANAAKRAEMDRHIAANAADRAGVVSEFLSRKREAEANRIRAGIQMGWHPPHMAIPDRPQPQHPQHQPPQVSGGDAEYLEKLKAIRMQNYKERQIIQQKLDEGEYVKNSIEGPKIDAETRRKKIEALKAQADERAAKLKEQLEKQRREMFEREQKQWQEHLARKRNIERDENAKGVPIDDKPMPIAATPGVSMTGVLQDVGVNLKPPEPPSTKSTPEVPSKEKSPDEVAAERKKWGGGDGNNQLNLADLPLQETASKMEATSSADVVTKFQSNKQPPDETTDQSKPAVEDPGPRKKWGPPAKPSESKESADVQANRKRWNSPGDTVVGLLHNAAIQPMTMTVAKADKGTGGIQGSPLGVTVVKKKGTVSSKTIVIKEGDNPTKPGSPQASSTPVTDKPVGGGIPSDGGSESESTSGGVGEESDTSTHATITEDEPSTGPPDPTDGGDSEVDSGVVSVTPSPHQEIGDDSAGEKSHVPYIRPMSAPSTNKRKSAEETGLVSVQEGTSTSAEQKCTVIDQIEETREEDEIDKEKDENNTEGNEKETSDILQGKESAEGEGKTLSEPNNNTDHSVDTPDEVEVDVNLEPDSTSSDCKSDVVENTGPDETHDTKPNGSASKEPDTVPGESASSEADGDSLSGMAGEVLTPHDGDVADRSGDENDGKEVQKISSKEAEVDSQSGEAEEDLTPRDIDVSVRSRVEDEEEDLKNVASSEPEEEMQSGMEKRNPQDVDVAVGSAEEEEEMEDMEAAYREALGGNVSGDDVNSESSSDSIDETKEAEKSVTSGLTTGIFDADSRLLRTCSLPDLSKLFRTTLAFNSFFEVEQQQASARASMDAGRPRDDGNGSDEDGNESDDEREEVPDSGEQDEDEEEAYQSMVESMKHLLEAVDGTEQREGDDSPEPPLTDREVTSPTVEEEGEESSRPINEDWDSGEGSYDDDGEDDDAEASATERRIVDDQEDLESVFLRLEESRMELEHELGCDKFLRAYTAVQAIHEDEDENIEEGTTIIHDILGSNKQHLYTKILQLVMADGAYTEDNE